MENEKWRIENEKCESVALVPLHLAFFILHFSFSILALDNLSLVAARMATKDSD